MQTRNLASKLREAAERGWNRRRGLVSGRKRKSPTLGGSGLSVNQFWLGLPWACRMAARAWPCSETHALRGFEGGAGGGGEWVNRV